MNDEPVAEPVTEPVTEPVAEHRPINRGAVISGVTFMALGVLFWADSVSAFDVEVRYLWPLLLIGIGLAGLLSTRRS